VTTPHQAFQEAEEREERLSRPGSKVIPLVTSIVAVLAALATLFAHHRSISALSTKNNAVLLQERASDQYAYYEARRVRYSIASALLTAGVANDSKRRAELESTAKHEQNSALTVLQKARDLEAQSLKSDEQGETILKSFETIEIGTTFFEISIVLASISALSQTRVLFFVSGVTSLIGLGFLIVGLFQAH